MDLAGKNVFITGAARGIGAATARDLAGRGARLALVGLEPNLLAALATELGCVQHPGAEHTGDRHVWIEADVTDSAALQAATAQAVAALGGLDAVVANAGIASFGSVRSIDPEAFARTVDVNLTGVFRTVQATLPHLIDSRGYVLVVSSLAALIPMAGASAYGASKAGVEAFADALRIELAPLGVSVGCAHMCWVDTDMVRDAERDLPTFREMRLRLPWPLRSTTSVADCAAAFVRAISQRSRRVNVPGVIGFCHWIRPLVHSRLVDALIIRRSAAALRTLEAEITTLGRSVSWRAGNTTRDSTDQG
ncbi:MAG TPA: SDR family oxidoreductase [Pseudonocardiaceae bacterium]|nr:SDR family oxidoreductase [Pseudonocardiaceae bacterium]